MLSSAQMYQGVFGPRDLDAMSAAYQAALSDIPDEGPYSELAARDLRRLLASAIIAEARRGNLDPARLKEAGLWALRTWNDVAEPVLAYNVVPLPTGPRSGRSRQPRSRHR